jgi:cysteinyl-tRNA synthetase
MAEAVSAYRRLEGFAQRAAELVGPVEPAAVLPEPFMAALDDDLGTPAAVAVAHDVVRSGNAALSAGDRDAVVPALASLRGMLAVLGLDPFSPQWTDTGGTGLRPVVDALVGVALEQRANARARRDFAAADTIRDSLTAAGVTVEDTPAGPRWSLDGR